MKRAALVVLIALAGGLSGAAAEDQVQPPAQAPVPPEAVPQAPAEGGRYSFHRVGDVFVRLDSVTGQVAQCAQAPTGWSCTAAPDERTALESEIARLQRENAALKKSMLAKGLDLPGGVTADTRPVPPASVPDASPGAKPPSEADLDRAIAYMKNVWKKLVDMMLDLQRDIQQRKS